MAGHSPSGALRPLHSENGILFDDFVESSFLFGACEPPGAASGTLDWCFPHHPPGIPTWLGGDLSLEAMMGEPGFRCSARHPYGCLFAEHARRLHRALGVPTAAIWHPTETLQLKSHRGRLHRERSETDRAGRILAPGIFRRSSNGRTLGLQRFGWCRRNAGSAWLRKDLHRLVRCRARPDRGSVHEIQYPRQRGRHAGVARNVVFLELSDSSANNVIIEHQVQHAGPVNPVSA